MRFIIQFKKGMSLPILFMAPTQKHSAEEVDFIFDQTFLALGIPAEGSPLETCCGWSRKYS